jgi:DNA-binding MarR family transcriptional regulator
MTVTAPAPGFGSHVVGQAEKALSAVLDRQLAGTGLTEPQWVTLTLTVAGAGPALDPLVERVAGALKVDLWTARDLVRDLRAANLVRTTPAGAVEPTEHGAAQWACVRAAIGDVTERLWGDLPAADLAATARVLTTVLTRANALLAES